MTDVLKHRGFLGSIEHDLDDGYLYGEALHTRTAIYYEGETIPELRTSFESAVDAYIADCESRGVEPEKSCSGQFQVRVDPDLHRRVRTFASETGDSINAVVASALESFIAPAMNRAARKRIPSGGNGRPEDSGRATG